MRRVLAMVLLVGLVGGCSSSGDKSSGSPAPTASTTTTTVAVTTTNAAATGLVIQVNELDVNKSNVYISIEVKNTSPQAQQFDWPKLVLTGPDGSTRTVYRDPGAAKTEMVAGKGFLLEGGYFQYDRYRPGRYSLAYNGEVLTTKTL